MRWMCFDLYLRGQTQVIGLLETILYINETTRVVGHSSSKMDGSGLDYNCAV